MFPCRVSWKNYLIFLGKVCIFFEHSILPIIHIMLNEFWFNIIKSVVLVGKFVFYVSCFVNCHNSTTLVLSIYCEYIKILWTYKILSCPPIFWNYLKTSEIIRWFPADSENIWIYLNTSENILNFDDFLKTNEIIWNYLMISGIVWNCHI